MVPKGRECAFRLNYRHTKLQNLHGLSFDVKKSGRPDGTATLVSGNVVDLAL